MGSKILVTGGSGLLGHALQKLCPEAVFLSRADGDLRERSTARRIIAERKPEKLIHLAAHVGGVRKNALQNADLLADNILINTNVLNAAVEGGVQNIISVLSSCVFASDARKPQSEADLHTGLPYAGNLGYGFSKRLLDVQTRLIAEQYGVRAATLTPVTLYGPHDNWDPETGHVLSALITKCFRAREEGGNFEIWGSGRAVRQFVFVEDIARLLLTVIEDVASPETLIAAPDGGISIGELAALIARLMDFNGPLVFDAEKPEGQLYKVIQSDTFHKRYPEFNFTPLEDGLKKTIDWYLEHEAGSGVKRQASQEGLP